MTQRQTPRWPSTLAKFACDVSQETLAHVAGELAEGRSLQAKAYLTGDAARLFAELLGVWEREMPSCPLALLSNALLAACAASREERGRQRLELVWSGPSALSTTLRSTGPALLELISSASESVYIVTFAAYKVPSVASALAAAERRGVRVVFVVESGEDSGGKVDFDPLPHLRSSGLQTPEVYVWPPERRRRDERGRYGSLHAKFAVADRRQLLVSSANLTEYAFDLNIELGVVISGGHGPVDAVRHIDELVRLGVLVRAL